jgi:cell division ATPase FtsA
LGMPVRLGVPSNQLPIAGLSANLQKPTYATSVGLLLWGLQEDDNALHRRYQGESSTKQSQWVGQAMRWLRNLLPG